MKKTYAEEIVEEVRRDFDARREKRRALELQWRLNMNFLSGDQYCEITPTGDIDDYGKQYWWQCREVFNQIASVVETRLAKLARVKTGVAVRPASDDDGDVYAAKLSTQVLKAAEESADLARIINSASSWSEATGTCFIKVGWDAEAGRIVGVDKKGKALHEGDLTVTVVPPFEIFPDNLLAGELENCRSVIHAKAYHVDEVRNAWGVDVRGEDVNVFSLDSSPAESGNGYLHGVKGVNSSLASNHCVVLERYELPTRERPDGRLTIVAADKLLYDGDLPYINRKDGTRGYPFAAMRCLDKVGCVFGASVIERLIPLQRAYNDVRNRKHEYMNRLAMGVLAVEDGSVDRDILEEEGLAPGKVLVYRQGSEVPRMLDPGRIPSDFVNEEERLLSEFITVSGVSELSKYSQTYSSMSGTAISLLVEQDNTRLASTTGSLRECIKQVCYLILRAFKQFAGEKRFMRLAGDNGAMQLKCFSGSDLTADDLAFETDNELNDTLASRRNMVLQLVQLGILQGKDGGMSERNKSRVLELLGFGNWENAADIADCQRDAAIRENAAVKEGGKRPEITDVDDDNLHVEEHTKALLSDGLNARAKKALTEHVKEHKQRLLLSAATSTGEEGNGQE